MSVLFRIRVIFGRGCYDLVKQRHYRHYIVCSYIVYTIYTILLQVYASVP